MGDQGMALGDGRPVVVQDGRPRIEIGGASDVSPHLVSLVFEETVNRPSRCHVVLEDDDGRGGFRYANDRSVDFGIDVALSLMAGSGSTVPGFTGRIFALGRRINHGEPPRLTVDAYDRLQDLAMSRRARHIEAMTVADVVAQTAADYGLAAEIDLDGAGHAVLVQANESDLAFLTRLLNDLDAELWIDGDTLHATLHSNRPGATVMLRPNTDLFELAIDADLADQRRSLTVSGWDVADKATISASANYDTIAGEVTGLVSGGQLLAILDAPGPNPDERAVHLAPTNAEEAHGLAGASYARASREFVTLHALARGRAELRVGAKVDLNGAGSRFDGHYAICRVRHTFDTENGYRTELDARRSGLGR